MIHASYLGTNVAGEKEVLIKDEFQNAAMEVRMNQHKVAQQAALNADPKLLEPVAGVTVDQWARAAAALVKLGNATPQQVAQTLASVGLDKATYDAANAGWQAKMQGDTTFVIATKYGEAFSAANNVTAGGAEPVSFEKYVEIMAAQACWSERGLDVNAELQRVFGVDAATYGSWGQYWSPKMGADVALVRKYSDLEAKYRQKYAGARNV